jgi:murein DD-endopeptidase MepM/ murein hydrolase activator NlpD
MLTISQGYTLWSFRREIIYVSLVFIFVAILTVLGVLLVTQTGIPAISDSLVSVDPRTHKVTLHYPNGAVYKELDVSSTWPVTGIYTLEFGQSDLPYQPLHTGIDIANSEGKIGDPVTPFMPGKVIYIGLLSWGYGKYVVLDHSDSVTSLYAHLSRINVTVGQDVKPGDIIGLEGSTGWSTGPHLHFQINVFGIPVNPRLFVQ